MTLSIQIPSTKAMAGWVTPLTVRAAVTVGDWVQLYGRTHRQDGTIRDTPRRLTTARLDTIRIATEAEGG
jgi:hypothetical protein